MLEILLGVFQRNWTLYILANIMIGNELADMSSITAAPSDKINPGIFRKSAFDTKQKLN